MDETGFQIGVGKNGLILSKNKKDHYFGIPQNRESATVIEAISAAGEVIHPFIILAAKQHRAHWYRQPELHPETVIATSPTAYSNDEIAIDWIKHFERKSSCYGVGSYRLLILDGHGSHHTREFIQFCDEHKIIPFGLPPNLTHLLQPLDVVVFQPYKHYYSQSIEIMVRDGLPDISKIEFLSSITEVRKQTFKTSTILSAFKETGISPWDPEKVFQKVRERQHQVPAQKTPSPPQSITSSNQTPLTLRQLNKVADRIEDLVEATPGLDPTFSRVLGKFVRGSLINATELLQAKDDLDRTKQARKTRTTRRAMKNHILKTGGVLTVGSARYMVAKIEEQELAKARRLLEAAEQKALKEAKKVFFEAAKAARKMRLRGILQPILVTDEKGSRALKRI